MISEHKDLTRRAIVRWEAAVDAFEAARNAIEDAIEILATAEDSRFYRYVLLLGHMHAFRGALQETHKAVIAVASAEGLRAKETK